MNNVSPKSLLYSKWTKIEVRNKKRHFIIVHVKFDEKQKLVECVIEAVINKNEYNIDWRDLKNSELWRIGWC